MSFFRRSEDTGTVFRDVIFLMMVTFVILFLVAVIHINPDAEPNQEEATPPGNVIVNIFWEDGRNIDVDLWTQGPKDQRPVGYSNRAGRTFNLLRDDLGSVNDDTELNFENGYTRGIPDGEYIINVHMFSHKERPAEWPVEVKVVVSIMDSSNGKNSKTDVFTGSVMLERHSHEVTAVRFRTEDKKLVPESVNFIEKKLRTGRSSYGGF
ncbi:MAG: hypothetical protein ACXADH_11900 [Candidatus Kariarchaeaceae archaeon]|jgi:hypothetical protein